jgi:hypothetical protein
MNCIPAIHPAGQPSAVRKCFLHFLALDTFFWRRKKKCLAKGESFKANNQASLNSLLYCRFASSTTYNCSKQALPKAKAFNLTEPYQKQSR